MYKKLFISFIFLFSSFSFSEELHGLVQQGNLPAIKKFIEKYKNNKTELKKLINTADIYSKTPLHYAARDKDIEIAELLLQNGADVNAKQMMDWAPLHTAVLNEDLELAKLLVRFKADINIQNINNDTPLHVAIMQKPEKEILKIMRFLIESGADLNKTSTALEWTPLHTAVIYNNLEGAQLLLESGADLNAKDAFGYTPYKHVILRKNKEITKFKFLKSKNDESSTPASKCASAWKKK